MFLLFLMEFSVTQVHRISRVYSSRLVKRPLTPVFGIHYKSADRTTRNLGECTVVA